ncbi:MAG TPA: hypothetical protein VNE58_17260 [Casimicrobiaceae bacterium]|nr:hypothetical protein [Casimicrobiaceae bacterium]
MRLKVWLGCMAFLTMIGGAQTALAQNCATFTDVLATNGFCNNIQWIRNRGITLGCGGTQFCPLTAVTREQMAAFMERLGIALTPEELGRVSLDSLTPINISSPTVRCQNTTAYTVNGYPRRAYFNNKANFRNPNGRMVALAEAVFSTDNGATWTAVVDSQTYQSLNSGLNPPDDVTTYQLGFQDLVVGTQYIFGVRVQALAGGAGTSAQVYCSNRVSVVSRQSTTGAPFDGNDNIVWEGRSGRAAIPPVH